MSSIPNNYFHHKSIRDPLYGFVDLTKLEIKIIDTPVFRRLHGIKQLSHAFVAYPSAIHTRFEHSLGVTHLADRMSRQLDFDNAEREVIRLSGLLHDIGHGPFSHLFETVIAGLGQEISHEQISKMIIEYDPEISEALGDKSEQIIQLLNSEKITGWDESKSVLASDIVSSALDADKLDYLRRDSYHIGVAYGHFDLERIIHTLTHPSDKRDNPLCVQAKGIDAIENYRLGRYLMHAQVYKHHARIVSDQMFLRAMNLAIHEEKIIDKAKLQFNVNSEDSVKEFLKFYTSLDDRSVYDMILRTRPGSKSAEILRNISERKLLKRACEFLPVNEIIDARIRKEIMEMTSEDMTNLSNDIADEIGIEQNKIIAYRSDVPIGLFNGEIWLLWEGKPRELDDISPIKTNTPALSKFYIFGPGDDTTKQNIREFLKSKFNLS